MCSFPLKIDGEHQRVYKQGDREEVKQGTINQLEGA